MLIRIDQKGIFFFSILTFSSFVIVKLLFGLAKEHLELLWIYHDTKNINFW